MRLQYSLMICSKIEPFYKICDHSVTWKLLQQQRINRTQWANETSRKNARSAPFSEGVPPTLTIDPL